MNFTQASTTWESSWQASQKNSIFWAVTWSEGKIPAPALPLVHISAHLCCRDILDLSERLLNVSSPLSLSQHKAAFTLRLLSNPVHPEIRNVMSQNYGIQFPQLPKRTANRVSLFPLLCYLDVCGFYWHCYWHSKTDMEVLCFEQCLIGSLWENWSYD